MAIFFSNDLLKILKTTNILVQISCHSEFLRFLLFPGNIAEGHGRNSTNDYLRFLQIASDSIQSREIERMLSGLIKKVRSN